MDIAELSARAFSASTIFCGPSAASFSTTSVSASGAWNEVRLKQDDLLLGTAGDGVLFLAGGGQVVYPSGAVVDVTEGAVIPSGGVLQARHRYLVAEETSAMSTELARMVDDSSQIVEDLEGKVEMLIEDVNKFSL